MTLLQATITPTRALVVTDSAVYVGAWAESRATQWPDGRPVLVAKQTPLPNLGAVLTGCGNLWAAERAAAQLLMARDIPDAAQIIRKALATFEYPTGGTELFLIAWLEEHQTFGALQFVKRNDWRPAIHTPRGGTLALMSPAAKPGTVQPKCMDSAEAHARATILQQREADPHAPLGGPLLVTELTRGGLQMRRTESIGMPALRAAGPNIIRRADVDAFMGTMREALHCVALPGGVGISWAPNTEADYRETEVRVGASWAAGTTIYKGPADRFTWAWPAAGTYTLWAKHRDTSGIESASATSTSVTVDNGNLISTDSVVPAAFTQVSQTSVTGPVGVGITTANTGGTSIATQAYGPYSATFDVIITASFTCTVTPTATVAFQLAVWLEDGAGNASPHYFSAMVPGGSAATDHSMTISAEFSGPPAPLVEGADLP